jgi:hypothetical protein
MNYVGIDWAYGRAAYCAMGEGGEIRSEGLISADDDGLAKLVLRLGSEAKAAVEMMSGAVWVRDRLESAGWEVHLAHARKVRDVAPLACGPLAAGSHASCLTNCHPPPGDGLVY